MATWVDGVAEGMVTSRANNAEYDAARAQADARSAQSKATRAESRADQAENGQILLVGKINELRESLANAQFGRGAALYTIQSLAEMIDAMPPVVRESFRDTLAQKTRAKFDAWQSENKSASLYDVAKEMKTLKSVGVV